MKTMSSRLSPQGLCGPVATHVFGHIMYVSCTSCAQVHELPQIDCCDNHTGTFIS